MNPHRQDRIPLILLDSGVRRRDATRSRPLAQRLLGMLLCGALLAGCAPTAEVTRGGGATVPQARAEQYDGPKARLAVGRIIDKTGAGKDSLAWRLAELRHRTGSYEGVDPADVTSGIRDVLTTAFFQSNRYIVLEREAIGDVLVEQEFSASGRVGEASRIPAGAIEGAELLVVGALTAFDPGLAGAAFPVPIPLNKGRDVIILDVEFRKAFVAMDLRVIDTATGRIVSTVAVEGTARKIGTGVSGIARTRYGHVRLPVLLRGFVNTPVERAISEMADQAVAHVVEKTPAVYYRHPQQPSKAN
jgi:curli biogenesis system outer membrane secretion channel CsgG